VIGGRVLDTSALTDLAQRRTAYAAALVDTAASVGITLLIPGTALLEAWQQSHPEVRPFLDLLTSMPTGVVDQADPSTAAAAGVLAAEAGQPHASLGTVHAVHLARTRDWPIITADPEAVLALDPHVRVESLP
jgi:hypothetical protein